eukprot:CAMPEP_0206141692 /NCGR_PEP_ID=MMETSP1473-20131121/13827_1 /ASSEMBLY_ACC=CAM_ASM_001109 /TAXON_ID=1461547 /ORGANISM="Stichococcus sp, Strain RCC1054" /LENGTH=133 /DNA_ID=CAMNT_0053536363 /DNA_START=420 /DNA_END=817 /DNA_ORIENTATION=-
MNGSLLDGGPGDAVGGRGIGKRVAFRLWPVHIHDPARGSIITAAAMAGDGGVVYLGTSSGRVERHRVVAAPDGHGARLSLVTTRHIGKKGLASQPVKGLVALEALQRVAVLMDGLLHLVAMDSLEGAPLPGVR